MIIKLIMLIIFNIIYTLNNYSDIKEIIIINTILFLFDFLITKTKIKITSKKLILSLVISSIIMLIGKNEFLYGYKNKEITITKINESDIRINSIYLNNEKQKLNNLVIEDKNPYVIYNKIDENYHLNLNRSYKFNTNKSKKVIINFEKYNYEYKVLINNEIIKIPHSIIDNKSTYYRVFDNYFSYEINNINYSNEFIIICLITAFLGLNIIVLSIIEHINKKNLINVFLALSLILFEYNNLISINLTYKTLLFTFIIITYILLNKYKEINEKKYNKKENIIMIISGFISSIFFIGDLFLDTNITINHIFILMTFTLWITYIIQLINLCFNKLQTKIIKENKNKLLDKILLFIIPLIIFIAYMFIFYPFIITTDGNMQLMETNGTTLSNWHPYFHTIIIKIIYKIFGNYQAFIIIRIILVSFIISLISNYFIKKGINKKIIYIITILFCLNPIVGIYIISFLKDTDYIIFLVLLTFIFIKYINKDLKNNLISFIILFLSLIFVATFRHNGLYVSIFCIITFIILFIKDKQKIFTILSILSLITIIFINTFLYNKLSVQKGLRNSDIVTLAHGLQAIYHYTEDKEIENLLDEFISKREFKDSYAKYNIDVLLHYNTVQFREFEIDKSSVIKLYLKKLVEYPNILISDRLYGTDILWNIFKKNNVHTYDYQIDENEFGFEFYTSLNITKTQNFIQTKIIDILLFISNNKILNAIFLRAGIYLWLIIILSFKLHKKENILILLPCIINILTLLIAMHHQSYRYVMFMPIIFILYFLNLLIKKEKQKNI